ncbi:glycosyltransferase [Postechiella marina]|uniref:Glycosyltransferase n=1 Tax=Postechiella marina TaxID=943941 RepID=A0ABP8C3E2_9FLAO
MRKRILIAPLNWGLGHATRCIPIIKALLAYGFEPIIASDGEALLLLQKEFATLSSIELPSYNITYAKKGKHFKLKMIKDSPYLIKTIKAEKKAIKAIVDMHDICGIISDSRLGVYSKKVPSVFITHQLNVLSGTTSWLSTKLHQKIIKKFDECWVPDNADEPNLSGKLGHTKAFKTPTKYLGLLSRFNKKNISITNDILVLLSGPEPQRTLLEEKLFKELNAYNGSIIFVRGVMEKEQKIAIKANMSIYNFMTTDLLEKTINQSRLIISRSGYTTIMDLAKLKKHAFFIATPGQFEQEYLALRLTKKGFVPSCNQDDFTAERLKNIDDFKGLKMFDSHLDFKDLFGLFECK